MLHVVTRYRRGGSEQRVRDFVEALPDHEHVVVVGEDSDHLTDGVALTDVGQELVAQPGALGGPFDDAGDVDEGDRRGNHGR